MNEEEFNLGERVAMKVETIRLQPEFLLRPLNEDHVSELEESYKTNPNTHPAIIVQPFEDDYTVRAHAHTFQALVNIGQKRVNVRVVKGPEYEVLSYLGKEQALTKQLSPTEWGNYLLRFYDAMPHKSLREMEKHFPFGKSRIQQLISGVTNKDVLNLMGRMQWSFDKARRSVQQLDSQEVEETEEELTESHEGHPSDLGEIPIPPTTTEDDGDSDTRGEDLVVPKISPDGEPEKTSEDQTQPGERLIPTSPSESSPSKLDYPLHVFLCMCGDYFLTRKEYKNHIKNQDCPTKGYQQYLNRVDRDLARAYIPSQKNGGEYWIPHNEFIELAKNPDAFTYIDQVLERIKDTTNNVENAIFNAKSKVGVS